tara:strand:- start:4730 stop:4930 length:201 start_codon:yes stop_codon:yes gene_type:complete
MDQKTTTKICTKKYEEYTEQLKCYKLAMEWGKILHKDLATKNPNKFALYVDEIAMKLYEHKIIKDL